MSNNIIFCLADMNDLEAVSMIYDRIHEDLAKTVNYPKWPYHVYPSYQSAYEAISQKELYVYRIDHQIVGSVILNHKQNSGYEQAQWLVDANEDEVLVVHTLAVDPCQKGQGYAGHILKQIQLLALKLNCLAIRLDLTQNNIPARNLYQKHGFYFTGLADLHRQEDGIDYCEMYEYNLQNPRDRLQLIEKTVNDFVTERDWHQYHTATNLSQSIIIEAAELLECFQWDDDYDLIHVCEELADVLIYCIQLALHLQVDIKDIILDKMLKNRKKYPVENCK